MTMDETKLSRVRALMAAGDTRGALTIVAKFPRLGEHKERITRAWAAATNPTFYTELGRDPAALVADGIAAIHERYKI